MATNEIQNAECIAEKELYEDLTVTLDTLPDDCILSIFDHLDKPELIVLSLVSRRLRALTDRTFRYRFSKTFICINNFPSLRLQKFGSFHKIFEYSC